MPYSVPTAIPPRQSLGPICGLIVIRPPLGDTDRRDRIGEIKAGPRAPEPTSLFAPARKYQLDLARALIDEGDLRLDNDIAESAHLRRQSLRFGGQRMKFDVRRDNTINRNRKGATGERRRLLRDQLRDLYLHFEAADWDGACAAADERRKHRLAASAKIVRMRTS